MACLAVRSKDGVYVSRPSDGTKVVLTNEEAMMCVSENGSLIAVTVPEGVRIHRLPQPEEPLLPELETVAVIQTTQPIRMLSFSPNASFLATGHRWSKEDSNAHNVIVWSLSSSTPTEVIGFTQKVLNRDSWPMCHWSLDEKWMTKLTGNEAVVYNGLNPTKPSHRLRLEDISAVSISPCAAPNGHHHIAVFVSEQQSAPGRVSVIKLPAEPSEESVFVNEPQITGSKSMFKAKTVEFAWNSLGTILLAKTSIDVDTTGKTYYGESNLVYLKTDGTLVVQVNTGVEGPIHTMQWAPNGKEFIVIAGLIPPRTLLYNSICQSKFDFGTNHRNTVRFNRSGHLICIAGFGNFPGGMDFYEKNGTNYELIGNATAQCAVQAEWSPDGRHFLTSVCAPRVRVDNGTQLWKYDGTLIASEPIEVLYETVWQKCMVKERPLSPRTSQAKLVKVAVAEKPKAYRAPGSSGALAERLRQERVSVAPQKIAPAAVEKPKPVVNLPPGADVEEYLQMLKKKEKEQKKKEKKDAQAAQVAEAKAANAPPQSVVAPVSAAEPQELDLEKRIKALKKKLKQVEQIKASVAEGKAIDDMQREKLSNEKAFLAELAECEQKFAAEKS